MPKGNYWIIFTALILLNPQIVRAQHSSLKRESDFLLKGGISFDRITVKDESFSSIPYTGWKPGYLLSLMLKKQQSLQELTVKYNDGELQMTGFPNQRLKQSYLDIDYTRLYKIGASETAPFEWLMGGLLNALYVNRDYYQFINRNNSFDFAISLGVSTEAAYTFQSGLLGGLVITDRISIPFISSVSEPAFGSEQPEGNLNGNGYNFNSLIKSNHVSSFSSYLRIKNSLSVQKNITHSQLLSFQYGWDYYQITGNRKVKQALHSLGITYQILF